MTETMPDTVLYRLIQERGLKPNLLAVEAGIDTLDFCRVLRREDGLRRTQQASLAKVIGMPAEELFDKNGNARQAPPIAPKPKPRFIEYKLSGTVLQYRRHAAGITSEAMGSLIACTASGWEQLEIARGRCSTTDEQRRTIAVALGSTVREIWNSEGYLRRRQDSGAIMALSLKPVDAEGLPLDFPLTSHLRLARRSSRVQAISRVAKAVSLSAVEYEEIESGVRLATTETAERLADYFGRTIPELFSATLLALPADVPPGGGPVHVDSMPNGKVKRYVRGQN